MKNFTFRFFFTTLFLISTYIVKSQSYCVPSSGTFADDVTNVTLGCLNNTTACESFVGNQGTAIGTLGSYSDFTSSTVPIPSLPKGVSNVLSVTMNTCSNGVPSGTRMCMAYIDFNQDFDFYDPGETITVFPFGISGGYINTASVNFTVPETASLGKTRMRVITTNQYNFDDPCFYLGGRAEAEDYLVEIIHGPVLFVDSNATGANTGMSWNDAFTDLQSAIDVSKCKAANQIWVSKGTYYPTKDLLGRFVNDANATFQMRNNLSIIGGFSVADGAITLASRNWKTHKTSLSGDLTQIGVLVKVYNVINNYNNGVNNTAVLDGFTIEKALNNANGLGGGVINANTSPTFLNCTFFDNYAAGHSTARGGAIHNQDGAAPIITNCEFLYNGANGLSNAFGAAISNDNSSPIISRSTFIGNIVSAPNAVGGGIYSNGGNPVLINNSLFKENNGAAICADGNNTELINVSISGNTPTITSVAGGLCFINSNANIYNSIIHDNIGGSVHVYSGIPTFAYSDIEGSGAPANWNASFGINYGANIDANPRWNSNYKLYACSPAVNSGSAVFGLATHDLAGSNRVFGTAVDMGAFENISITTSNASATICAGGNYEFLGSTYSTPGPHNILLAGAAEGGCDSTIVLTLTITPNTENITNITTCGSFLWAVTNQIYSQSGSYNSQNGCVAETLNLTINDTPGAAIDFDGVNDYAQTFHTSSLNFTQFTIETWLKWNRPNGSLDFITSKGLNFMEIHTGGGSEPNNLRFIPVPGVYLDAGADALPSGAWVHLAAVYNPSAGLAKLYINGLDKPLTQSGPNPLTTPIPPNTQAFILGARITSEFPFKGQMDEFRLWNRALSQAEIMANMNCEIAESACGLVLNQHMNNGIANGNNTGSIILNDYSGNGNSAVLTNFDLTCGATISNFVATGAVVSGVICTNTQTFSLAQNGDAQNGLVATNSLTNFVKDCKLISSVKVNTPVVANSFLSAKVFIDVNTGSYNSKPIGKRHYDIKLEASNSLAAEATITLYFTQTDFDEYNAANPSAFDNLPIDNADLVGGRDRLRIFQFHTDANGLPNGEQGYGIGEYTTFPVEIDPADDKIVWNAALNRWEVTFDITGFSGFFLTTNVTTLPITLISFTGKATENGNTLNWKTDSEKNFSHFEIQRSENGKEFEKIGKVEGNHAEVYQFLDQISSLNFNSSLFYRLKIIDLDGSASFSKIISIENDFEKSIVGQFYPNPTLSTEASINIISTESTSWLITSYDLAGKILKTETRLLNKGENKVKIKLEKGSNLQIFRLENGNEVQYRKVIQQ
jgi:Concanavalin A-like lectin/glucanases superfamily/GEVED domain